MLKNAYLLAKIGADTAENEQHHAEMLPIASAAAGASPSAGSGDAGLACEEGWVANKDLVGLELQAYLNL